jgi:nucleoside-diphosphate-sugar epimerase
MIHTILGAGGSIANALTANLLKTKQQVRLVSRRQTSFPGAESVRGDVTSYSDTLQSIQGSDVVYLCVGLKYDSKVWAETWPKIMQNTIDACKKANTKLIFFDNVYMYGKVEGKMTEDTPYNPCSRKGEIRAKIATLLETEMKANNLKASIARSADFYGPYATVTSVPYFLAIENMMKGKKAQWLINANLSHSFTYTLDCARALVLLANTEESFNQVWHLPTSNPGITGKRFIELVAKELNASSNFTVLGKVMMKVGGIFNRTIYEAYEMIYQSEFDYYFDSNKFNTTFQFTPTPYESGIIETIRFIRENR